MSAVPECCALPGCDEPIEQPTDGGPRRKFCTATHRAAARRLRREERTTVARAVASPTSGIALGIPAQRDVPPSPTPRDRVAVAGLPSRQHEQGIEHQRQLVAASHAANAERRRKAKRAVGTRRRGIAVLGAASILAAGGGWVVIDKASPAVPDSTSTASSDAPSGTAEWASRAKVALASVNSQLDLVNQVQAEWNALPGSRSRILPQPVVELLAHKTRLEQQRAMLESELSALKSLETSRSALASTEGQLASVERALKAIPSDAPLSTEQSETARQLKAQRDLLAQQRENQNREVLGWDNSIRNSVTKPLPELEKVTEPVTDTVIALIDNSDRPSSPPVAQVRSPIPAATNRQDSTERARQDYNTGAPPDPGRPTWDEAGQRPDTMPSSQPVEQVTEQLDSAVRLTTDIVRSRSAAQDSVEPEAIEARAAEALWLAEQARTPSPAPRTVPRTAARTASNTQDSQDAEAAVLRQLRGAGVPAAAMRAAAVRSAGVPAAAMRGAGVRAAGVRTSTPTTAPKPRSTAGTPATAPTGTATTSTSGPTAPRSAPPTPRTRVHVPT